MKKVPHDQPSDIFNIHDICVGKGTTNRKRDNIHSTKLKRVKAAAVSTSSTTSFCSCCNNPTKSNPSLNTIEGSNTVPLSVTNVGNNSSVSKKHVSLGCQTNIGKEVIVELAVYHGDTKVVSKSFEFPNSTVTDKTMVAGKAFEVYYEIVNDEMLQVWGVENHPDDKNESTFDASQMRRSFCQAKTDKEQILENLHCEAEKERLQALVYWTKAQTEKCKSIILDKYDEIWKMLDKVTVEALTELATQERELVELIEDVSEFEIDVTDYNDILSKLNYNL